jgi:hypothetical protein
MSKENAEAFVAKAIQHAKSQWCLDDEAVVREWCERRADGDVPEALVDEAAERYGLTHSKNKAGAVRDARQLLDEYKDVIQKELSEAVMAKLSS